MICYHVGNDEDATPKCEVVFVLYGEDGKTEELSIGPEVEEKFKPGANDEFQVQ